MDVTDKARRVNRPAHTARMFIMRKPVDLDSRADLHARPFSDTDAVFHVIGHQPISESERRAIGSKVLPPILDDFSANKLPGSNDRKRLSDSDSRLENECIGHIEDRVENGSSTRKHESTVTNHHQFLQTQGFIPGVDSHVTIRHPYVMKAGINPTVTNAFHFTASANNTIDNKDSIDLPEHSVQFIPSDTNKDTEDISNDSVTHNEPPVDDSSWKASIQIPTDTGDMSDSEYDISTFPPVRKDEISRHSELNKEAEKNSKSKPHAYNDYLQKLQVQKRLLVKPKQTEAKVVKRKNKKIQFKTMRLRDTKEDLFDEKPDTPPKPKNDVIKPMKVIQSFRYSRAIAEYYKGQMDSRHSLGSVDEDTATTDENDKVENGWLVKSLGPQVLNLYARTLPSCNPLELRLRRQHARQRSLEQGRLSKRSSSLSVRSMSQRLSRSHDSFIGQGQGSVQSNRSADNEAPFSSSPVFVQPSKGRFLPEIPEVRINDDKVAVGGSANNQRTTLVLSLPLLTSDA